MINEEQNKKAVEALKKVEVILDEVKDLFPLITKEKIRIKLPDSEPSESVKILKRVNGIIKNFNEDNAERKLKSLLQFVSALSKRK